MNALQIFRPSRVLLALYLRLRYLRMYRTMQSPKIPLRKAMEDGSGDPDLNDMIKGWAQTDRLVTTGKARVQVSVFHRDQRIVMRSKQDLSIE